MADNQEGLPEAEGVEITESPVTETPIEQVAEETPEAPQEQQETEVSQRADNRWQELANENRTLKEELARYKPNKETVAEDFVKAATPEQPVQQPTAPAGLPWVSTPPKEEMTIEDYQRDVVMQADAIAQAKVSALEQRLNKENEIKSDYNKIVNKYSELDPENSSYNPVLSEKIGKLFKEQIKVNPKVKLLDFTNSIMELREGGREQGKTEVTQKLVQQKAEEAITPSATAGEQDDVNSLFSDPSRVKEQEAYLKKIGQWGND